MKLATVTLTLLLSACASLSQPTPTLAPGPSATQGPPTNTLESPSPTPVLSTATGEPSPTEPSVTSTLPDAPDLTEAAAGLEWSLVAEGFARPVHVTHAGDERLFVVAQAGVIWVLDGDGSRLEQPFLDIHELVGSQGNEQGLLSVAFHPQFQDNGWFFVDYTDVRGDTVVARYTVSSDPDVADPGSAEIILAADQPYANHNGGQLQFGPDGYLYVGLGDGGSQGDPHGNGQRLDTFLGKILRIDINSGQPYGVPPDNPDLGPGALPEIWAYGLRNPWRFSFDRATGDMYIGDVGQNAYEEIDFQPAGVGGLNYGWNILEGNHEFAGGSTEGLTPPIAEISQQGGHCSITGGYVYRGRALPQLNGVYVFGDFCSGVVWGLLRDSGGTWQQAQLFSTPFRISSFGEDRAGELYLVDLSGGVYRLQAIP